MNDIALQETNSVISVIEKVATSKDLDVSKMEKLLEMQERVLNRQAEIAFNNALSEVQKELPAIQRDAVNSQTSSRYSKLESINMKIIPVYTKHGFSLSFGTEETSDKEVLKITCDVSHAQGHTRQYHYNLPWDKSGIKGNVNKTDIHALGSTISYGRRYLTMMIFNLVISDDTDGVYNNENPEVVKLMEKFTAEAEKGFDSFKNFWIKSPERERSLLGAKRFANLKEIAKGV